jgi:hypothetical protein
MLINGIRRRFVAKSRGDLVQQGLEQVIVATIHERYPTGRAGESPRGRNAAEAAAHDHDMRRT